MKKPFHPEATLTADAGIFGLPYHPADAKVVLLPVPWEATTSYGGGTSKGPESIHKASHQLDLFDRDLGNFFEAGIAMTKPDSFILKNHKKATFHGRRYRAALESGKRKPSPQDLNFVNKLCHNMVEAVRKSSLHWLDQKKMVGVVGGDHSSPLGLMRALDEKTKEFSILHFDAHADLRDAYQGFQYSHASIMFNALKECRNLKKLVGVGYRDFCESEFKIIEADPKVEAFFDKDIKSKAFSGTTWKDQAAAIVAPLTDEVYVSFDIDGLEPAFCPHTGTPVPGGLTFEQAIYILEILVKSGRRIIGFDLCEVAPGPSDWDANVGARVLYQLCGWTLESQKP